MSAPNGSPDDNDPFGGGHVLENGVAPPVIGASSDDPAGPARPEFDPPTSPIPEQQAPPTAPIPVQSQAEAPADEKKPGFFGRLFGR